MSPWTDEEILALIRLWPTSTAAQIAAQLHRAIEVAIHEGWNWLMRVGLLMPQPGVNGQSGFMILTRRAEAIGDEAGFQAFCSAATFPKSLLHPTIADDVWLALARGDLSVAVFIAFRAVEIAVRDASKAPATLVGVDLAGNASSLHGLLQCDGDQLMGGMRHGHQGDQAQIRQAQVTFAKGHIRQRAANNGQQLCRADLNGVID